MSLSAHLQELKQQHSTLSKEVAKLQRNPATDSLEIAKKKKQKLALKEEINRLETA